MLKNNSIIYVSNVNIIVVIILQNDIISVVTVR